MSVASDGTQANGLSDWCSISADGRLVAFRSAASNLVSGDGNATGDIFVHDRLSGVTERVSVASDGTQANADCRVPDISGDGRYVAFESTANNLVAGDTNGQNDVFVHDRLTGVTERVSVSTAGAQSNNWSGEARLSGDGRYVVFSSFSSNLVSGDTNSRHDVFVRDRLLGTTERVSISTAGAQGNSHSGRPSITPDGQFVAFYSDATTLVSDDTNAVRDIFVRDRVAGVTERVNVSSAGEQGNSVSSDPTLSADGRYVAFFSYASNLVPDDTNGRYDVFVHDRDSGEMIRVSVDSAGQQGNGNSEGGSISGDGMRVAFASFSSNLVPGDTNNTRDIFVHDRATGDTERVSVSTAGAQANSFSNYPFISANGAYVVFPSFASNLVSGDTNGTHDIFVRSLAPAGNTPTGANVAVDLGGGMSVTFTQVTAAGDTSFTTSASPPGGPPSGFRFLGVYYDLVTTAGYSGPVTITLPYDPAQVPGNREPRLKVFHWDPAGGWQDVTVSVDMVNDVITGVVSSLSWFAVGYPIYEWQGFLPPVAGANKPFRRGSTIPVKFRISDAGAPVSDAAAVLAVYYLVDGAPAGEPEVISTASGDWGNQFRYDGDGDLYIFNLSTKDASYLDYFTYQAEVTLDDGETYAVVFSLK